MSDETIRDTSDRGRLCELIDGKKTRKERSRSRPSRPISASSSTSERTNKHIKHTIKRNKLFMMMNTPALLDETSNKTVYADIKRVLKRATDEDTENFSSGQDGEIESELAT